MISLDHAPTSAPLRHRHLILYVPEVKESERLKQPITPGSSTFGTVKGDQLEPPLLDTSNSISVIAKRFKSSNVGYVLRTSTEFWLPDHLRNSSKSQNKQGYDLVEMFLVYRR